MRVATALLLTGIGLCAADYPRPVGYVNDYTGILPEADRHALESKLQAYEQSTSIEIAVAIVTSLEGRPVEDYARDLFRDWGIGKRVRNNGVLFLWAPNERKVRIQVGYGLESELTNTAAAGIVGRVTTLFRRQEFTRGVYAGVDGILERLDHNGGGGSVIPVGALLAGLAVLIGVVMLLQFRRHKHRELVRTLPRTLESSGQRLRRADAAHTQAVAGFEALRREAPEEVWTGLDAGLADAPVKLAGLREELGKIAIQPRQEYRELRAVERAIGKWQRALAKITMVFDRIVATLATFRDSRRSAENLLVTLPGSIAGCRDSVVAGACDGKTEKLLEAARATHAKAREASISSPANWLLICDLLLDAQDCVHRAHCLTRGEKLAARSKVERRWAGSDVDSPAIETIDAMFPVLVDSSGGSGMYVGGSSGGSDSGGFGGGDSGSGGASGSY